MDQYRGRLQVYQAIVLTYKNYQPIQKIKNSFQRKDRPIPGKTESLSSHTTHAWCKVSTFKPIKRIKSNSCTK